MIETVSVIPILVVFVLIIIVLLMWAGQIFSDASYNIINVAVDGEPRGRYNQGACGCIRNRVNYAAISPAVIQYRIQGCLATSFSMKNLISLSFTMMNGRLIGNPWVSYLPEETDFPLYSNEGNGRLIIEHQEPEGGRKRLAGRYQGTLVPQGKIGPSSDGNNSLKLDLSFDVAMHEADLPDLPMVSRSGSRTGKGGLSMGISHQIQARRTYQKMLVGLKKEENND